MNKRFFHIYSIFNYIIFLILFLYFIGFVNGVLAPKSIDTGVTVSLSMALIINALLITLFGIQHSIMARPRFKTWWKNVIPAPIERSSFVLLSNIVLFFLMWQWRPITNVIWYASNPFIRILLWIINATGWTLTIVSTRLINSDHFFGLKQTKQYARNQPVTDPPFQTPGAYRITRHPMMLGFLIAFWITPDMTAGHLYFSSLMTIYIFIGLRLEEKGLVNIFGKRYQEYRKRVSMLIPGIPSKVNARKWQTDK